eukprot:scaffold48_cov311-Pinguiococcus_pyrenoidosus.AAC.48
MKSVWRSLRRWESGRVGAIEIDDQEQVGVPQLSASENSNFRGNERGGAQRARFGPRGLFVESRSCLQTLVVAGLKHLRDHAGSDRSPAFPDRESQTFRHRHATDELHLEGCIVPGHDHLRAVLQRDRPGDVGSAEEKLGLVVREEGLVSPAFLLRQDVNLAFEVVSCDRRSWCGNHLPSGGAHASAYRQSAKVGRT